MRYAIGDIHGGAKTFRALLDKINLRREDRLYLLGDYVDRGPDSKGVLDIILHLMEAGYDVRPVRGNHDDMMLRTATGNHDQLSLYWLKSWGKKVLQNFGVDLVTEIPTHYLTLIESMPYIRFDDNFVFVHAGLDMEKDDPITQSDPEVMTWPRTSAIDNNRLGGRKLVTGHTINSMELIKSSLNTNHILLDNGACTNGQPEHGNLLTLNLDTLILTNQPWCDGADEQ